MMHPKRRPEYKGAEGKPGWDMNLMLAHVNAAARARADHAFDTFRSNIYLNQQSSERIDKQSQSFRIKRWPQFMLKPHTKSKPLPKPVFTQAQILACFGAAHAVLCDAIPGYRPKLYSAWDRRPGLTPG